MRNASSKAKFLTGFSPTRPPAETRLDQSSPNCCGSPATGTPWWCTQPDDLRALVQNLTRKAVRVEFVKESVVFTGEDSPMANLMLSVMGAFAEFERSLIRERQREGIALAKQRGAYKGRKKTLTPERAAELVQRADSGVPKAVLARDYGISRETVYQYLRHAKLD